MRSFMGCTVALSASLAGCFGWAAPTFPPPTVQQDAVVLASPDPQQSPIRLEGAWVRTGPDTHCVEGGSILVRPSGMRLANARICMTTQPLSLEGEADVVTGHGVTGRARIALATGQQLRRVGLGDVPLALDPARYYLRLSFTAGRQLTLGAVSVSTQGGNAELVVDALEPAFYASGDVSGLGQKLAGVAVGVSPAGRLQYRAARSLPVLGRHRMSGHVLVGGTFNLARYPMSVRGEVLLDTERRSLAANGILSMGASFGGLGFDLRLGDASLVVRGDRGDVYFAAGSARGLLRGPLAFIRPPGRIAVSGHFRSPSDMRLTAAFSGRMHGFRASDIRLSLGSHGAAVAARLRLPLKAGSVRVSGSVTPRGVSLRGRASLRLLGVPVADATVTVGNRGVHVQGRARVFGGSVGVQGRIAANGRFQLRGSAAVRVGFKRGVIPLSIEGRVTVGLSNRGPEGRLRGRICWGKGCKDLAGLALDRRGRACVTVPVAGDICTPALLR